MINTSDLIIRHMESGDPSRLATAFAHMGKNLAQYIHYWQENLDHRRVTLIAETSGRIAGYANIIWEPEYQSFRDQGIPEINDVNVIVPLRDKGIGTRMIRAAENCVKKAGKTIIGIGYYTGPGHEVARRLYPKLGYVYDNTGTHPDPWGECMYLTKKLE
jgi:GNAT superfamily N-acetyltransferase